MIAMAHGAPKVLPLCAACRRVALLLLAGCGNAAAAPLRADAGVAAARPHTSPILPATQAYRPTALNGSAYVRHLPDAGWPRHPQMRAHREVVGAVREMHAPSVIVPTELPKSLRQRACHGEIAKRWTHGSNTGAAFPISSPMSTRVRTSCPRFLPMTKAPMSRRILTAIELAWSIVIADAGRLEQRAPLPLEIVLDIGDDPAARSRRHRSAARSVGVSCKCRGRPFTSGSSQKWARSCRQSIQTSHRDRQSAAYQRRRFCADLTSVYDCSISSIT